MYALIAKDFRLFFKDKRAVLLSFLLPIVLISLFAFAFGGVGKNKQSEAVQLLVIDKDHSAASVAFLQKIQENKAVRTLIVSEEKARDRITAGDAAVALVIHKGFAEKHRENTLELWYDQAKQMQVAILQPIVVGSMMNTVGKQQITNRIRQSIRQSYPELSPKKRERIIHNLPVQGSFDSPKIKMTAIVGQQKDTNLGLIQAVAGTAILMLLFSIASIGSSLLEEKESGTLKRLLYSPIKPTRILFAKMCFAFIMAVLQLSLMFLFAWLAFKLNIFTNIPALVLMIVATAFAVSSFGIFLMAISKTRAQAQSLSTLIVLIMSAIGGSMIPLFIMPAFMQKMAIFSVNYWGIQGFYDIFWRHLPTLAILPRVGVLLGIGVLMSLVSVWLFNKNLLKLIQ